MRQILNDIEDARSYGISLRNNISLNELYSYLVDARRQKTDHEKKRPKETFHYDDGEEEQPPLEDGLDDLSSKVRVRKASKRKKKRGTSSKRKRRV